MDTTEQTSGYYFDGLSNISAGELYFWVFLDEAGKQLGVTDLAGLAMFILGQPIMSTRAKPMGTTKGTSPLSYYLRQWLTTEVKQWRTLTTGVSGVSNSPMSIILEHLWHAGFLSLVL